MPTLTDQLSKKCYFPEIYTRNFTRCAGRQKRKQRIVMCLSAKRNSEDEIHEKSHSQLGHSRKATNRCEYCFLGLLFIAIPYLLLASSAYPGDSPNLCLIKIHLCMVRLAAGAHAGSSGLGHPNSCLITTHPNLSDLDTACSAFRDLVIPLMLPSLATQLSPAQRLV